MKEYNKEISFEILGELNSELHELTDILNSNKLNDIDVELVISNNSPKGEDSHRVIGNFVSNLRKYINDLHYAIIDYSIHYDLEYIRPVKYVIDPKYVVYAKGSGRKKRDRLFGKNTIYDRVTYNRNGEFAFVDPALDNEKITSYLNIPNKIEINDLNALIEKYNRILPICGDVIDFCKIGDSRYKSGYEIVHFYNPFSNVKKIKVCVDLKLYEDDQFKKSANDYANWMDDYYNSKLYGRNNYTGD